MKPSILVIDDQPNYRRLVQDVLSPLNYQVECAGDGISGIKMATEQSRDLIMIDVRMPGMDGLQVLDILKHHPKVQRAGSKLLLMSAEIDSDAVRLAGNRAQADGTFSKSISFNELIDIVRTYLDKPESVAPEICESLKRALRGMGYATPSAPPPYLFGSYARSDLAQVRRRVDLLRTSGVETWIDIDRIDVGTNWEPEIDAAIRASSALLLFMSENARNSSWIRREIDTALTMNKRILGLKIAPVDEREIHPRLPDFQWLKWY